MEFRRITNLPAVRLHDHQRPEGRGTASGRGRDRPRLRQPRHPLAGDRGREAGRGRPHQPQPPLLDVARASPSCARRWPRSTSGAGASQLDPELEITNTIGSKEGFSHLMWVLLQTAATRPSCPARATRSTSTGRCSPAPTCARCRCAACPTPASSRTTPATSSTASRPRGTSAGPSRACSSSRSRTTRPASCVDLRLHAARRRLLPRAGDGRRARLRLRRHRLRRLRPAVDPAGRRGQGVRGRAVLDDQELLDGRLARARSWSATPRSCRRSSS